MKCGPTIAGAIDARARAAALAPLNAFISLTDEEGDGPVVAVKDLMDVRGTVTTAGGRVLPDVAAASDATAVARIRAAGGVVVGKTNLHEFAFGPTSHNEHYGDVRNPHDWTRVAGGSSGGSAVAVACGACNWATGTDTGGSIRIPASLTGVVGFKPTLGMIDTGGVFPLSRTLDTVGSFALDVATATTAVATMSGVDVGAAEGLAVSDLRLGVPRGWVFDLDDDTARAWRLIATSLPEIDFPNRMELAAPALTILEFEASRLHREWLERTPELYGTEIRERLRAALRTTEDEHRAAVGRIEALAAAADAALNGFDALLVPATACVAPRRDDHTTREPLTRFARPFNTTGQPVVTLPAPSRGLPVGIQVVAARGADGTAASVALALEHAWRPLHDNLRGGIS